MRTVHHFATPLSYSHYSSKYERLISFFVEEFFSNHDEVDSNDLEVLEKEIRNAIRVKIDAADQQRSSPPQYEERKLELDHQSNSVIFSFSVIVRCVI